MHNTKKVEQILETLTKINEGIQTLTEKRSMLLDSLRHSGNFMSDKGKHKMYHDIDIATSAKIRLTQRFNNLTKNII